MSVFMGVWAKEDGEDEEPNTPDVSPRTFQTPVPQQVGWRHHWSQLHKLLHCESAGRVRVGVGSKVM